MRILAIAFAILLLLTIALANGMDDKTAQKLVNEAKVFLRVGSAENAIEVLDKVIKERQAHTTALHLKGKALAMQEKHNEAIDYYDRALSTDRKYMAAWYDKVESLIALGKCYDVPDCCQEMLRSDPSSDRTYELSGIALTDPRCLQMNYSGTDESESELYKEALEYLNQSLILNKNSTSAWNNKGIILAMLSQTNESLECFEEAIRINASFAEAWNNKGVSLNKLGRHNEALKCYDTAISLDPQFAEAWFNKGQSLAQDDERFNEAQECYLTAIEINPELEGEITWVYKRTMHNATDIDFD